MAGIAKVYGVICQPLAGRLKRRPERLNGHEEIEQYFQIVRLRDALARFFQARLEIFFRALLRVKTDSAPKR
jgi:hypothetical protein